MIEKGESRQEVRIETIGMKSKAVCVVVGESGYKSYKSVRSSFFIFMRN